MNEHTYWNSNGPEQAKYDEMEAAGFEYTKATQTVFHSYYRYYNDGDLPGWARSRWDVTRYTFRCWLLRLGFIGDEFATAREHLLKNLPGNSAWRQAS